MNQHVSDRLLERADSLSGILCCPGCRRPGTLALKTRASRAGLECQVCGVAVAAYAGIPDFAPHLALEDKRFRRKQKIMNSPAFARLYETPGWRPFHAFVASHGSLEQEIDDVLALSGNGPGRVAVDLACGTGLYAREMARRKTAATVLGVDISIGMLAHARELAERAGLQHLQFMRGDIYRLPFADASVDHVNCCAALHLFPDLSPIWREIARVLKPGGAFTAMTVARRPLGRYSLQAFLQRHLSFKFFEPDQLAAELRTWGLEDYKMRQRHASLMFGVVRASGR